MRLINRTTLELEEFFGNSIPPYAILSHTWGDDEVTFVDLPLDSPKTRARAGYQKIEFTCQQALADGVGYAWVDTCCIDKRSSSELSEAINSMFAWYRSADHCYAYLFDVQSSIEEEQFGRSRWFTRGWTLQELLAPRDVVFYSQQWERLGQKSVHTNLISKITEIDAEALIKTSTRRRGGHNPFGSYCVAKRMSWASRRETTRIEDLAYCLLGVFDINMPLLYGEGSRAFHRLQEEIIRRIDDDSILAWGLDPDAASCSESTADFLKNSRQIHTYYEEILARSPWEFRNCGSLKRLASSRIPFALTNAGLTITLPILSLSRSDEDGESTVDIGEIGILSCAVGNSLRFVGILLRTNRDTDRSRKHFSRVKIYSAPLLINSFTLGPRDAVNAVSSAITIDNPHWTPKIGDRGRIYQQIVVNISATMQNTGYRVQDAHYWSTVWRGGRHGENEEGWNPEAMTFTLITFDDPNSVIGFYFESLWLCDIPKFTVFMRTDSSIVIVRHRDEFSDDEKLHFSQHLGLKSSEDDYDEGTICDRQGKPYRLKIGVRTVTVHHREISELTIDAVPIAIDGN
ncbi:hypothetical protein ACJBU6_02228 [Exserohilum turcicum]